MTANKTYLVQGPVDRKIEGTIALEGSKSESNRALIIYALQGQRFDQINGLSTSDDTQVLSQLLQTKPINEVYDVGHAGTSFRFLTAYLALQPGSQILTGSDRLKQRPIAPLVDALNAMGARISYIEKEGFAPLKIDAPSGTWASQVTIDSSVSSQFISALLLIAPMLPQGLTITMEGDIVSTDYIRLTLATMAKFGIRHHWTANEIKIPSQPYQPLDRFDVEADWSAVTYYVSMMSLATEGSSLKLQGLEAQSNQADKKIMELAPLLGVEAYFVGQDLLLEQKGAPSKPLIEVDFVDCPDLAQGLIFCCAAKGIFGIYSGMQTLVNKETDRIEAIKSTIQNAGLLFYEVPQRLNKRANKKQYMLDCTQKMEIGQQTWPTYADHRMALALAPWAMLQSIILENIEVVSKSYPRFWKDVESLGFTVKEVHL